MSTALGSSAQLMLARETTPGTAVAPTRAYPFVGEGIDPGIGYIRSAGLRSDTGRGYTAAGRLAGRKNASASTEIEINNKGFGLLLRAILGNNTTTQPNVGLDPTVYDHTMISAAAMGVESHTIETGWIDDAAAAYSKTAVGAMVDKAEISVAPDTLATCAVDWLAQNVTTATSRTTAAYAAALTPLGGGAASLLINGVAGDAVNAKITINNNLDGDRFYLGGAGQRKQPIAGRLEVAAEFDADFKDWNNFNRVLNNTYVPVVLTLPGAIISHAYTYQLVLTMNMATVGDAPKISGPGRIPQPLKMEAYDDGTGPGSILTAVYRTTDATP